MEAGKSDVQSHPQLHNELEASLGYIRSYLKPRSDFIVLSSLVSDRSGQDWRNQSSARLGWRQVGEKVGRSLSVRLGRTELAGLRGLRIKNSTDRPILQMGRPCGSSLK